MSEAGAALAEGDATLAELIALLTHTSLQATATLCFLKWLPTTVVQHKPILVLCCSVIRVVQVWVSEAGAALAEGDATLAELIALLVETAAMVEQGLGLKRGAVGGGSAAVEAAAWTAISGDSCDGGFPIARCV